MAHYVTHVSLIIFFPHIEDTPLKYIQKENNLYDFTQIKLFVFFITH